jgi:hypothetical protein
MLHIQTIRAASNGHTTPPTVVKVPAAPINLVSIRAKPAPERAQFAVRWTQGGVVLRPTVANAAVVFKISPPYIFSARNGGTNKPMPSTVDLLTRAWHRASPAQRVAFAQAIGPELLFESTIAPALEANGSAIHSA